MKDKSTLAKSSFSYWVQTESSPSFGHQRCNKTCLSRRFDVKPIKWKHGDSSWCWCVCCGVHCRQPTTSDENTTNFWAAKRGTTTHWWIIWIASLIKYISWIKDFRTTLTDETVHTSTLSCETFSYKWTHQTNGIIPIREATWWIFISLQV